MVERGLFVVEVDLKGGSSLFFEVLLALRGGFVGEERSKLLVNGFLTECLLYIDLV